MTPRAGPLVPSTVTSRSTERLVAEPTRRMSSRATLLWRRSWLQICCAFSLIGAKFSFRTSEMPFLSQSSAVLRFLTAAFPFWAFVAWANQAARIGATGFQRSSRLVSSTWAAVRSASTAAMRAGALDSR